MCKKTPPSEQQKDFSKKLGSDSKEATIKQCIWKECGGDGCNDKIIAAHSIQRGKILSAIADSGNVYYLGSFPTEDMGQLNGVFEKNGIKSFSTFKGFCKGHDKSIFQPIEDLPFTGTEEQKNIYAFRAAAKEFHTKCESVELGKILLGDRINEKYPPHFAATLPSVLSGKLIVPPFIKDMMVKMHADEMVRTSLKQNQVTQAELKMICMHMKEVLEGGNPEFEHIYYSFDQEYPIACNTTFIPYFDHNGKGVLSQAEVNRLASNQATLQTAKNVFLNVFPEGGRTHVIFSFFKNNQAFKKSIEQLFTLSVDEIKQHLSSILLNYAENMAFKPSYIDANFDDAAKEKIKNTFIASIHDQGAFRPVNFSLFIDAAKTEIAEAS